VPTSVDVEWLAGVPLFEGLSPEFLAGLAARVTAERVVEQHVVVRQGEAAERFYIIARGKLLVTQVGADGREVPLRTLNDGDYFGEIGLLRSTQRSATVRALVPSLLLSLSREQLPIWSKPYPP
jgi:ATP-binding cassette subfamily B protein